LTELYSSVERGLIDRHPSTWTPQEVVNATWRQESIGVLLWALSEYEELPPYDSEFANVAEVVPVLAPTEQFVTQAVLRPDDEIERARDVAELWHWRSRTTQLQNAPDAYASVREEHDLDAIVRAAATHAYEQGDIAEPIGDDFPAFGKAYRDLTDDEYARATSIAMERHLALNWLCGSPTIGTRRQQTRDVGARLGDRDCRRRRADRWNSARFRRAAMGGKFLASDWQVRSGRLREWQSERRTRRSRST
jgi:hypothetical protein